MVNSTPIIVRQRMAIPQVTMDGLTMFPGLKRQATDQVAVPKQGTTEMATERQVANSAGGTSRNSAGSSGSSGPSSVGDNRLKEDSNNGGQPPAPLTRDDIPALVREITRQLRSDNTEAAFIQIRR